MLNFNEIQSREFIKRNHEEYYKLLATFCKRMGLVNIPDLPNIEIVDVVFRHCGQFNPTFNRCQYSLPYCAYEGDNYHQTIAHEMVHAFQRSVKPNDTAAHGHTFLWLLSECGIEDVKNQIYHSIPYHVVEKVAEELKRLRGGYTEYVSMQSRQRKTLKDLIRERNKQ